MGKNIVRKYEYEYKVEEFKESYDSEELEVRLDSLGKQGWKLVAVDAGKFIFFRQKAKRSSSSPYDFR